MKKLLLLFAAVLMASTGLWAETQNVSYLYPVYYTDGDATSGIKEWKTASVDATVVTDASEQVTWNAGWYVVTGTDVTLSQGVICSGNVRLILADGAKLTATGIDDVLNSTPGIQVSGDGNSLTIYGQTAQTGRLIATGKTYSAGIGGNGADALRDGSNITINGGTVTANGGSQAAAIGGGLRGNGSNITINGGTVTARGSAAGIGGGNRGNGTNIIINGGTVTARGGDGSDGIGNGANATPPSSNIFVATWCIVKAGSSLTPTDVIENTGSDLATSLAGKLNVTVETPKFAVTYGDNITVSPAFASGAEIAAGTQITFTAADRTADSYGLWGFYKESTFDTPITTGVNGQAYTVTVTDAAISVYARYEKYVSASYVYPVYNDPDDVTEGVKEWETGTASPIEITSSDTPVTLGEAGKNTWYVVTGKDVTLSQGAICYGNVNLILADGAKLTATGIADYSDYPNYIFTPGIQVSGAGNSLAIYGQTAQSGQLEAKGWGNVAGIGGEEGCSGSNITINGGTVTATGEGGAGIGGGFHGSGSNITINGGTVTAIGEDGAGIGGGAGGASSDIIINGGTVTATGEAGGAGIGGGAGGASSDIIINGGTVTANGAKGAAGIGGGLSESGTRITINGGTVTANGGENAAGIGGGYRGSGSNITVATTLIVKAGSTENPTDVIANNGGDLVISLHGKQYVTVEPNSVSYVYPVYNDPDDVTEGVKEWKTGTASPIEVTSSDTPVTLGEAGKTTWYVVTGKDVTLSQGAICAGDVNLILADGAKLTANGTISNAGITTDADLCHSLTIYGQTAQSGQLEANGGVYAAGIGGGNHSFGKNITINGGTVNAHGGVAGAGIGGGDQGSGKNITINGGTVTANGGNGGAGIGGGLGGASSDITINGGTVTANGGENAAGIGGGDQGDGEYITINGGTVTANGGENAAGIGGGYQGDGKYITINDGMVTANGGENAAGIGGGCGGYGAVIIVATNLIVKADGNNPPTTVIENTGDNLWFNLEGERYVTVTEPTSYKVQASPADESKGSVSGSGIYEEGTEVTLTATPAEYYVFEKWSDGTTANPYVFTATKDVTITAFFTEVSRYITDGTEYTAAESKFYPEVIYTRTFKNTDWQALYVPFSIDYEEWSEKFDIAKIRNFIEYDDDDNGTVDRTYLVAIKKASGSTEPNYPYLIRAKEAGTYSLVLKDKTLEAAKTTSIDCRSVENEYTFTGTYTKITDMYANGYYALAGGVLCKANSADVTLKPQRWYMEVTSRTGKSSTKAQSIQIVVDGEDETEGITAPSSSPVGGELLPPHPSNSPKGESPVAYDLMGRGVKGAVKGVSIVNGKKIIK